MLAPAEDTLPPMGELMGHIARTVRQMRNDRGWSLEEMAERAGCHRNTAQRVESAKGTTIDTLEDMARAFGVNPIVFFPQARPESTEGVIGEYLASPWRQLDNPTKEEIAWLYTSPVLPSMGPGVSPEDVHATLKIRRKALPQSNVTR